MGLTIGKHELTVSTALREGDCDLSKEIWHEVRIKAAPDAVYQALTDIAKLAQWWIPDTRGESTVGKTLEFWFSKTACETMQVVALEQNELVRWQPSESGMSDWAGTTVEFKIFPRDDRTFIHFRHSGYRPGVEGVPHYSMSWAVFLLSLKNLLENGVGDPFPNSWIYD
jgi:uncharacterized protein YndB with AHSA1/START domain